MSVKIPKKTATSVCLMIVNKIKNTSIVSLIAFAIIGCSDHVNHHTILKQVQSKFATDQVALSEFKHLGKVHCSDDINQQNHVAKNKLFQMVYADTFNKMTGLTRLFDERKMQEVFGWFVKNNSSKDTIYTMAFCHFLYENGGDKLYQSFISDKQNYLVTHIKKDDDGYENIWLDMQDYLKYGRLDASRYIDGCQTYDCR